MIPGDYTEAEQQLGSNRNLRKVASGRIQYLHHGRPVVDYRPTGLRLATGGAATTATARVLREALRYTRYRIVRTRGTIIALDPEDPGTEYPITRDFPS